MDFDALKSRILADPDLAALAGPESDSCAPGVPYPLSQDETIAATLRGETEDVLGDLTRAQLIQWVTVSGQRRLIEQHATDYASPLCDLALTLRDVLGGALDSINLADPTNLALLDAWLAGTVADADVRATAHARLLELATTRQPRWSGLGNLQVAEALGRGRPVMIGG